MMFEFNIDLKPMQYCWQVSKALCTNAFLRALNSCSFWWLLCIWKRVEKVASRYINYQTLTSLMTLAQAATLLHATPCQKQELMMTMRLSYVTKQTSTIWLTISSHK